MNKVILMGRLTRDPEVRYSQGASQTAIARFSIAVDRRFKREGEPDADFFNCTAFGKQAEFIERYLHKGVKVVVCGRIQNDNYTNKEGQMVYSVRVMVDEIEFAESKNASGEVEGSEKLVVVGPKGTVYLKQGVIIANRHIHLTPEYANRHNIKDGDYVDVMVESIKPTKFFDVQVRVRDDFTLEMHIDTDDANSTGIKNGDMVKIIK